MYVFVFLVTNIYQFTCQMGNHASCERKKDSGQILADTLFSTMDSPIATGNNLVLPYCVGKAAPPLHC